MTTQNLKMVRGDTKVFTATVTLNGVAVNLTGGTLRLTAKWSPFDADGAAAFQLSSPSDGIVLTTPTSGIATITITAAKTTGLPNKLSNLFYDLQFTDSASKPYTVSYGRILLLPEISITTP